MEVCLDYQCFACLKTVKSSVYPIRSKMQFCKIKVLQKISDVAIRLSFGGYIANGSFSQHTNQHQEAFKEETTRYLCMQFYSRVRGSRSQYSFGEGLRLLIQTLFYPTDMWHGSHVFAGVHICALTSFWRVSYSVTIRPAGASAGALGSHCSVLVIPQNKNFFLNFSFIGSHCLIASNVFGYTSVMFCIELCTSKQMA